MNWDKVKEGWEQYQKLALGEWPELTELDLTHIAATARNSSSYSKTATT